MKIIVDAMGGDNAPQEAVRGAVRAAGELGVGIVLAGREADIRAALEADGLAEIPEGVEIAPASEVIDMEDDPSTAVRMKRDSSMAVMLNMLRDGKGDAAVSAGSTGALLSGATLTVKRIKGIRRAALAPVLPTPDGGCILVDCGANAECTPEYLMQFAAMGSSYASSLLNKPNPRVALLNIGEERTKGTPLQREAYELIESRRDALKINFIGNIEARDVLEGKTDVVVCDGFSGNILLKAVEGTALYIMGELKEMLMSGARTKLAAAMLKSGLKEIKSKLDYNEVGGTLFLGVSKPVIKAHGSSKEQAFFSAIRQASAAVSSGVIEDIEARLGDLKSAEQAL